MHVWYAYYVDEVFCVFVYYVSVSAVADDVKEEVHG